MWNSQNYIIFNKFYNKKNICSRECVFKRVCQKNIFLSFLVTYYDRIKYLSEESLVETSLSLHWLVEPVETRYLSFDMNPFSHGEPRWLSIQFASEKSNIKKGKCIIIINHCSTSQISNHNIWKDKDSWVIWGEI